MRLLTATASIFVLLFSMPAHADNHADIERAVNDNSFRTDAQKARDVYRHPVETLAFFGLTSEMTVAEPLPGWYTEILGAMLRDKGTYIALSYAPDFFKEEARRAQQTAWPEKFLAGKSAMLGDQAQARFILTGEGFAPDNSVDAVLAFRAFHGWVYNGVIDDVLAEFFTALKPGGVLGIVQHREDENASNTPEDRRGYLKESFVIDTVTRAGFKLVEKSEINANPKDTKDYKIGVWALPPVLSTDNEEERKKHLAIGESDRMTLKFVKP